MKNTTFDEFFRCIPYYEFHCSWQVLSLENPPDWKENSHSLWVQGSEDSVEIDPIISKQDG